MRALILVALASTLVLLTSPPASALTDFMCVNKCLAHGKLYKECVAICSNGLPTPPASTGPMIPDLPNLPDWITGGSGSAPAQSHPAGGVVAPGTATGAAPSSAPGTPAKPASASSSVPAAAAAATPAPPPGPKVDYKCAYECLDRGHLFQYCQQVCAQ